MLTVFKTIAEVIIQIVLLPFRIIVGILKGIISLFKRDNTEYENTSGYRRKRS